MNPELAAWRSRLEAVGTPHATAASAEGRDWFGETVVHLTGVEGMHQLSNLGAMDSTDPTNFRASLLRAPVGELMLYSTQETPHTVTYERSGAGNQRDIVILGCIGLGGQRLRGRDGVKRMSVGRMGFMSSLAPSVVEHVGLTETTGVVVPADLILAHGDRIAAGVGLFPNTPIIRTVTTAFTQMLVELLRSGPLPSRDESEAETMLLGLVRIALQQLDSPTDLMNRAAEMRLAAKHVIERRHTDPTFTIEDIATELHISRRQLYRYFSDANPALRESLLQRRLITARLLLLDPQVRDGDALARAAGFSDAASLRAHFRRQFGLTPSEFRRDPQLRRRPTPAMLLTDEQSQSG